MDDFFPGSDLSTNKLQLFESASLLLLNLFQFEAGFVDAIVEDSALLLQAGSLRVLGCRFVMDRRISGFLGKDR
jgi:hypothetical protein